MYFKEKENTNIDSEFKSSKNSGGGSGFDLGKLKPLLLIGVALVVIIVIIVVVSTSSGNSGPYSLELVGDETITINLGDDYIEPGYKAYQGKKDVTDSVKITANINTAEAGEYEILYSINNINKIRHVIVLETIDKTYIYLKGKINMYLEVGDTYEEPGYEVYDSMEKDLTEKVEVSGSVDTSKVGTYQITYTVTNSRNKITTVKRTIIVVEKGKKPQN